MPTKSKTYTKTRTFTKPKTSRKSPAQKPRSRVTKSRTSLQTLNQMKTLNQHQYQRQVAQLSTKLDSCPLEDKMRYYLTNSTIRLDICEDRDAWKALQEKMKNE